MNVLLINHHSLDCNSGIHISHLANNLLDIGVDCIVCVPDQKESVYSIGEPRFPVLEYSEVLKHGIKFRNGCGPEIIHSWTPREIVREFTQELVEKYQCPYIVHLEDNEEHISLKNIGMTNSELAKMSPRALDAHIGKHLSHPYRYKEFISRASGVTVLIDRLLEFKPDDVPGLVFWPAFDKNLEWSQAIDYKKRQKLGIARKYYVIVYTGNVHAANRDEVFSLYLAVGLLNRYGIPVKLIRTGTDHVQLIIKECSVIKKDCIELGHLPRRELPLIMSLADVLVQPGSSNGFNDYRFPSKLPEFLATGRPVLLPRSNIGHYLKDGRECILLNNGNALEIAQRLEQLFDDAPLRERIGSAGRAFAEEQFSWEKSSRKIHQFYSNII